MFVHEQHCALETELDADDPRSWHWVAQCAEHNSLGAGDSNEDGLRDEIGFVSVGTLRLVPPPHAKHPVPGSRLRGDEVVHTIREPESEPGEGGEGRDRATSLHDGIEPYVKLGRLAALAEWRGKGVGRVLVEGALEWARRYGMEEVGGGWKGLVLIHAQGDMEGWWGRIGFVRDEGMGEWWEEGIRHVGMWRRVEEK